MVSEDRQRVIETNRSLRTIKNELESLLEKGVITDDAFDSIHNLLPTEASLSGAPTPAPRNRTNASSPPTAAVANLNLHAPPSYAQSTGSSSTTATNNTTPSGGPPALPGRTPPPPTTAAVIGHARALYRYAASDTGDCAFERDDRIAVHRHMNADWWMGRNLRTGQEGIFPRSYVEEESAAPLPPPSAWQGRDEKAAGGYQQQQPTYGGQYQPPMQPTYGGGQQGGAYPPPPPGQANPYNANAPPMAVAEQGGGGAGGGSKGSETGKKIGKKLGNAAIFGAGATIGSNIVNSIF